MKAQNVALRDNLAAALRDADGLLSTDELAALMPRRIEVERTPPGARWTPCADDHYRWRMNRFTEVVECRGNEHVLSRQLLGPAIYPHLRALENKGLCERVRFRDDKRAFWRWVAPSEVDRAREVEIAERFAEIVAPIDLDGITP